MADDTVAVLPTVYGLDRSGFAPAGSDGAAAPAAPVSATGPAAALSAMAAAAEPEAGRGARLRPLLALTEPVAAFGEPATPAEGEPAATGLVGAVDTPAETARGPALPAGPDDRSAAAAPSPAGADAPPANEPSSGDPAAPAGEEPPPPAAFDPATDEPRGSQPVTAAASTTDGAAAATDKGTGRTPLAHAIPLDQVAVHVSRAARAGVDRIEIGLQPDALGRIEIRLDVARDGRVNAVVVADSRDTLGLLSADARSLQQALQDAGLKADAGSLHYHLRGESNGSGYGSGGTGHGRQPAVPGGQAGGADDARTAGHDPADAVRHHDGRLDLFA